MNKDNNIWGIFTDLSFIENCTKIINYYKF